ncbi:unnamed protein product [Owenia fusiformis]|uniref:BET1 homolog n=1 Tax=Owenia fusiformis TaxID=6347 RepID=A0A8J1XV89_OWEFU|nr:unnamed protein product [Owenia fusiformis]
MRRAHAGEMNPQMTQQANHMEEENQHLEDQLSYKVKALKSLTIDIGTEVKTQNQMLKGMDDDFDATGGFLGKAMSRVSAIAKAGHNRFIFYLIMFALFVFMVCWFIIKTR